MAAENESREGFLQKSGAVVGVVYRAIMEGGQVQAAVRQGFNEIGAALQIDEPGAVGNPHYSDISADKRAMKLGIGQDIPNRGNLPTPSEIASGKSPGSVHGDTRPQTTSQDLPSPSQIASEKPPAPEQDQGQEHGRRM